MGREMNLLERESLYLITVNLLACDSQTDSYSLSKAVTQLRDCYWRNNANKDGNIDEILTDLNESFNKLSKIHRSLGETLCCLSAVINSIENRQHDDSQS